MPDHFVDTQLAPMVAISVAAAATDTLRIGTLVLGNDYKHPAVVAKEAATLDLLSDGRLEFGIGAGWMTADYDRARSSLRLARHAHRAARRGDRVVKGAWADGPFDFAGDALHDHGATTALPKPVQQPRPPILRRWRRPKRAARSRAARPTSSASTPTSAPVKSMPTSRASTLAEITAQKIDWVRDGRG